MYDLFDLSEQQYNYIIKDINSMDQHNRHLIKVTPKQPKSQQTKATLHLPEGDIQLQILNGSLGPKHIDIRRLLADTGYLTYDPGFISTSSCVSNITYIDGPKGQLLYRGYKIQDLAENSTFMETTYLLLYGTLPNKQDLIKFQKAVVGEMMVNERIIQFYKGFKSQAHPMAIMVGVVGALSAFMHSDYDLYNPANRQEIAIKLIAKMPTLAAYAYRVSTGLPMVYPKKEYGYMKNFMYMMFSNPMNQKFQMLDEIIKALQVIFICHADHQQNASTSTVRIAASSLANPFACIAAGIGCLWGPLHGGANEAVLTMLQDIQGNSSSVQDVIEKAKDKTNTFKLMGFGHRVYKNFDPRAKIMQKMCYQVLKVIENSEAQPLLELAMGLQKKALSDQYFIKRKLYPNVDFYTGIVYKAIGIPKSMFTVLFAVARSAGWMAQWCEMMNENLNRISRPRQLYVGQKERPYIKIGDRDDEESNVISITKLCKLTDLMKL